MVDSSILSKLIRYSQVNILRGHRKVYLNVIEVPVFIIPNSDLNELIHSKASHLNHIWSAMRAKLSLGFLTRIYQNQPAQLQRIARIVKYHLYQVLLRYFPNSEK